MYTQDCISQGWASKLKLTAKAAKEHSMVEPMALHVPVLLYWLLTKILVATQNPNSQKSGRSYDWLIDSHLLTPDDIINTLRVA